MTGIEYENMVGEYLKEIGCESVIVTKASSDFGVDIVANIYNARCAFQCKYSKNKIGQKAVREVTAGLAHYNADKGFVVTNNTISNSAKILAKENGITLWEKFNKKTMRSFSLDGLVQKCDNTIDKYFNYKVLDYRMRSFGNEKFYNLAEDLLVMDGVRDFDILLFEHGFNIREEAFILQCLKKVKIIPVANVMRTHSPQNDFLFWVDYKAQEENWTEEEANEYVEDTFKRYNDAKERFDPEIMYV